MNELQRNGIGGAFKTQRRQNTLGRFTQETATESDKVLLTQTVFSDSTWDATILADVNVSAAIGLESIRHHGPCHVSSDTLLKSMGKLPDVFLRGCGLSDWEIENARLYDPSLSAQQINDIQ